MNQYGCKNGTCIPIKWACDGVNDCGDNSDESRHCKTGNFYYHLIIRNMFLPFYWLNNISLIFNLDVLICR